MKQQSSSLVTKKKAEISRNSILILLTIIVVTTLIMAPVYWRQVKIESNDYISHIQLVQMLLNRQFKSIDYSHPLYQILLIVLYFLTLKKISLYSLAIVLQIVFQISTATIIYYWLQESGKQLQNWICVGLAISLLLVSPIMILVVYDHLWYLGYIGLEVFHNPTITLLRPFAIINFIYAVKIFTNKKNSINDILIASASMIASELSKPNYAICILPAIGLFVLIFLIRNLKIDWRLLIFGYFLPGCLVLFVQWVITYSNSSIFTDRIVFDFLGVEKTYSHLIGIKLFLSLLFPLVTLVLNFRKVIRDQFMVLAWFGLGMGLFQNYFLAEGGERYTAGNFGWSAQIMLFILFVASVRFLWNKYKEERIRFQAKETVIIASYLLHVIAGVAYNFHSIMLISQSPW